MSMHHRNIIIAFLTFVVLCLAVIVWEFNTLHNLDELIALGVNKVAAKSESLSLIFLLLADKTGFWVMLILFAVSFAFTASLSPKFLPKNVVLYIVFLGLLSGATALICNELDNFVRRDAPHAALEAWQPLEKVVDMKENDRGGAHFPDKHTAVFATLFFAIFFRFGFQALILLFWLLVFMVGQIAAGTSWASDLFASIIFSWLFVSLIYLSGINDRFNRLDSSSFKWIRELLRSSAPPVRSACRSFKNRKKSSPNLGLQVAEKKTTFAEVETLVRENYEVQEIEFDCKPHKGKVFPLLMDGQRYAFKKSRLLPVEIETLNEIESLVETNQKNSEILTPKILPTKNKSYSFIHDDAIYYTMEWMNGKTINLSNEEESRVLAEGIASFHAMSRLPNNEASSKVAYDRVMEVFYLNYLASRKLDLRKETFLVPGNAEHREKTSILHDWFYSIEVIVRSASVYAKEDGESHSISWCHRDIHPMNFLINDDGVPVILDFDRMAITMSVLDIGHLINRIARARLWDFSTIKPIIDSYLSKNPLSRCELALLLALTFYPPGHFKLGVHDEEDAFEALSRWLLHGKLGRHSLFGTIERDLARQYAKEFCDAYKLRLTTMLLRFDSGK